MCLELLKFKKSLLQLEPHTIFVAREADGGANHSTGILEPNEVKVIMCHAGRSYLMLETLAYIPKVTFISVGAKQFIPSKMQNENEKKKTVGYI